MSAVAYYRGPRPERRVVMRQILKLCSRKPRSAPELAKHTGSSLDSVHVLLHRLRGSGEIETLNPGTHDAVHVATGAA